MIPGNDFQIWRTRRAVWLACVFCVASFLIQPQKVSGQADEISRSWNQPVKPFRVIANVYYVGASDVTSYLITTPAGHVLLDSGFAETVPQIKQNIAALGFHLEDVKILLNSHAHLDHAGGLAELKALTKAKLFASEADAVLLANGGKDDPNYGDRLAYAPVQADHLLRDDESITLGGVSLTAHLTPGHTKGNTTWTTRVSDQGKDYQVVFVSSPTAPGFQLFGNAKYPNIVADFETTFRKLKELTCDVFLAPHGSMFGLKKKMELLVQNPAQNPFVDPDGYRHFLDQSEQRFRAQLKEQQSPPQAP